MNENLSELLTTLIQVVIIPSIPILVAFLAQLLRAKSNQAKIKLNNDLAKQYLQEATEAVIQAVTYTSQTYVDSLKTQGRFDVDAQKVAFATAKEVALALLTDEAKKMIADLYGDINVWLDTKIEQTVKEQKTFTIGTAVLEPIKEMEP
jgi:uncharacterized protein YbjQ (UPF0145 family)